MNMSVLAGFLYIEYNFQHRTTADEAGQSSVHSEKLTMETQVQPFVTEINHEKGGEQARSADVLLFERGDPQTTALPINLMEFGHKARYTWWGKAEQGRDYTTMLRNPTKNTGKKSYGIEEYKFGHQDPMLLSSIIIDKTNGNVSGEFGAFLCVPVPALTKNNNGQATGGNDGDVRLILLWRAKVHEDIEQASQAFGRIFEASFALREWRKKYYEDHIHQKLQYRYLGPDCAKFGDRLYRSYDTRIRPTDRSPDLYIKPGWGEGDSEEPTNFHWFPTEKNPGIGNDEKTKIALDIRDKGETLFPFGESCPYGPFEGKEMRAWIWESRGRLLVISVPYRVGGHVAAKLSDFKPILEHLYYLHSNGMVHGDIRAFNMVIGCSESNSELEGWLIDFDFGGKEGQRKYPEHYNFRNLKDGHRLGTQGQLITAYQDYYALWKLMNLHLLVEGVDGFHEATGKLNIYLDKTKDGWEEVHKKLSEYVVEFGSATLRPSQTFQEALDKIEAKVNPKPKNRDAGDGDQEIVKSPHKNAITNKSIATGSFLNRN